MAHFCLQQVNGGQRIDNDIEIDNTTDITFYVQDGVSDAPDCVLGDDRCLSTLKLADLGLLTGFINSGMVHTPYFR